jgi:superfamily II DNA/RNA helicase
VDGERDCGYESLANVSLILLALAPLPFPKDFLLACLQVIEKVGFTKPSAIQAQALPLALSGRDILGMAQTGALGQTIVLRV